MNYSTLFMICYIAVVRPYENEWANRVELANEFTILLLYTHCLTQTAYVAKVDARDGMGWSMIGIIILNIVLNFSFVAHRDVVKIFWRLRYRWIRNRKIKEFKKKREEEYKARLEKQRKFKQYSLEHYYG